MNIPDSKTPMKATVPNDENLTVDDGHNKVTNRNLIFFVLIIKKIVFTILKCCFQTMKATDPDDENLTFGDSHNEVTKCNLLFLY